jgi:hypothetical protein
MSFFVDVSGVSGYCLDMHSETKRIMRKIRSKLTRLITLENQHCGHEELLNKAIDARLELEWWLENELEGIIQRRGAL